LRRSDETFLLIQRAVRDDLLEIHVRMPREKEEELMSELLRFYKSDKSNPCAAAWNEERRKIMTEALEKNLYNGAQFFLLYCTKVQIQT
jgi:hypothetical protein